MTDDHSTRGNYVKQGAEFNRDTQYIEDRILDDPQADWPVETGRSGSSRHAPVPGRTAR